MLEAIADRVEDAEAEAAFTKRALASLAEVDAGGATFDGDAVHAWLLAKARSEKLATPAPLAKSKITAPLAKPKRKASSESSSGSSSTKR